MIIFGCNRKWDSITCLRFQSDDWAKNKNATDSIDSKSLNEVGPLFRDLCLGMMTMMGAWGSNGICRSVQPPAYLTGGPIT